MHVAAAALRQATARRPRDSGPMWTMRAPPARVSKVMMQGEDLPITSPRAAPSAQAYDANIPPLQMRPPAKAITAAPTGSGCHRAPFVGPAPRARVRVAALIMLHVPENTSAAALRVHTRGAAWGRGRGRHRCADGLPRAMPAASPPAALQARASSRTDLTERRTGKKVCARE